MLADRAAALPPVRESFKSVLTLRPDLVILDQGLARPAQTSAARRRRARARSAVCLLDRRRPRPASSRWRLRSVERTLAAPSSTACASNGANSPGPVTPLGTAVYPRGQSRHIGEGRPDGRAAAALGLSQSRLRTWPHILSAACRSKRCSPASPTCWCLTVTANANPARATEFVGHHALRRPGGQGAARVGAGPVFDMRRTGEFRGDAVVGGGAAVNRWLLLLVAALYLLSLAVGAAWWPWRLGNEVGWAIVWELRVPRATLGLFIGGVLGLSGAVLQGWLRNPLAEPGVIGVSACAGFAAVCAFYSGLAAVVRAGAAAGRHRRGRHCRCPPDGCGPRRDQDGVAAADGRGDQCHRRGADLAGPGAVAQSFRLSGKSRCGWPARSSTATCAIWPSPRRS